MVTPTTPPIDERIRSIVRERYALAAQQSAALSGGCGTSQDVAKVATQLGYSADQSAAVADAGNLGLGCGNPHGIASLKLGETVLDLGSGAGFDCFLAARAVGPTGHVIGVDMTHEMLDRARQIARKDGYANVEFRLGEIEHLPVGDAQVDVIISNCVVNLSPDKAAVFRDAFRVLRPGGRVVISDVVAVADIPAHARTNEALICGCMGNAARIDDVAHMLTVAGFVDVRITPREASREFIREWAPGTPIEACVRSAIIEARRPCAAVAG